MVALRLPKQRISRTSPPGVRSEARLGMSEYCAPAVMSVGFS